jgi:hypothetical protein
MGYKKGRWHKEVRRKEEEQRRENEKKRDWATVTRRGRNRGRKEPEGLVCHFVSV